MFIISQNEQSIINMNTIARIYVSNRNICVRSNIEAECGLIIATYKTKERALEVLKEIQEAMIPKIVLKVEGKLREEDIQKMRELYIKSKEVCVIDNRLNVVTEESYVYKMPKE